MTSPPPPHGRPYDPVADLLARWPEVEVVTEPLPGSLLGEVAYPVIRLRAGTSAAQRRSTLTHEIVHLDRGIGPCGPGSAREERTVEVEAARRLIPLDALRRAVCDLGNRPGVGAVAAALEVDSALLLARLASLTDAELASLGTTDELFTYP